MPRFNWQAPGVAQRVEKMYRAGLNNEEVAAELGVHVAALRSASVTYGWNQLPEDLISMGELAELLGLTRGPATKRVKKAGIKIRRYLNYRYITRHAAKRLLPPPNLERELYDGPPHNYYTAAQLAALWGCDACYIRRRAVFLDLPYVLTRSPSRPGQQVKAWHLADAEPIRPKASRTPPRGTLTTEELAERLRTTPNNVHKLVQVGMPSTPVRGRKGAARHYFHLPPVARWLAARPHIRTRRKGERLLRELGIQP